MSAISESSATFQALTMIRRESGSSRRSRTASAIWSTCPPSGVGQLRHCTPYTGPRSPSSRAHSSQMVTPRSLSQLLSDEPVRNHSSSTMIDFKCTFLVVTSGKPSLRSKRIWWPNTLLVPVPVRSALNTPWVSTWRMKSSYWERMGRVVMSMLGFGAQHPPRIEDVLRIQRALDGAHHRERHRRLVLFQLVRLERADTVLGRNRAAEALHRVV